MWYSFYCIWVDRGRYMAAILAVAFSAVLTAVEVGIFLGFLDVVGVPIVNGDAEIWLMYPETLSVSTARSIPSYWADEVWSHPSVETVDEYIQGLALWTTESGLNELVVVMGCTLTEGSLGPVRRLSDAQRRLLEVPGNVILDRRDRSRLEVAHEGVLGQAGGRQVYVCGFVDGMKAVAGPYVLCSRETARQLLGMASDQVTFLLARCTHPSQVDRTVDGLNASLHLAAWTAQDFTTMSKWYWFTKTKAGIAIAFAALLGLVLGASVVGQVLYAATVANFRELAVLRAMGVSSGRIALFILQQSFLVGVLGLFVALPTTFLVASLARSVGTATPLPVWLLLGTDIVVLLTALVSSVVALRALMRLEPMDLLR